MTTLRDNAAAGRLEMDVDGQIVFADYRRRDGILIIDHVEAPTALRGTGAAGHFMEALAAHARAAGERIMPICGYAADWLRRRPVHGDLLA